jgi:hypothetical protein
MPMLPKRPAALVNELVEAADDKQLGKMASGTNSGPFVREVGVLGQRVRE